MYLLRVTTHSSSTGVVHLEPQSTTLPWIPAMLCCGWKFMPEVVGAIFRNM